MRNLAIALAACTAFVAPAHAATVFSDNFNGEAGGASVLNYNAFANFTVSGQVDLVRSPDYGIACSGSCVDLDGTTGPGTLTSRSSFAFNAGDVIRLSYDLSGSQRSAASDSWFSGFTFGSATQLNNYGFNYFGTDQVVGNFNTSSITTSSSLAGNTPFSTRSLFFTAGNSGTLHFNVGTNSADNVGPVLDNVRLDVSNPVPEPATWAMMIVGFGVVGASMRRRVAPRLAKA